MPKITFIGAGSTVFAQNLLGDILSYPELAESTIRLHDIDPERLRTSQIVAAASPRRWAPIRPSRRRSTAAPRSTAPTTPSP